MRKLKRLLRKNSFFLILFFIISVFFVQCDFIYELGNETFDPYKHPVLLEGDTLIFKNGNQIDSLYVKKSQVTEADEIDAEIRMTNYKGEMVQINCKDTCLFLRMYISQGTYSITYNYPFREVSDPFGTSETPERKKAKYSVIIGDIEVTDLYKLDMATYAKSHLFVEINYVLYSKTYGFVQYTCFDGAEFVMSEETLEMLMGRE